MRPNVLWICTDQQRFDTLSALGNHHIRTPNIDRLVRDGVAFDRAYCQSPICTPSRTSFLTGMYPSRAHGCGNGNEAWANAAPLVTKLLADAGYDCGLAGKLHLSGAHGRVEPRPDDGYRVFHWSHGPKDQWESGHDYAAWLREKGFDLGKMRDEEQDIPAELHQTTWCRERAVDFISEQRNGPWLMSVNVFDPHPPFDPPAAYLDRIDPQALPGPHFRESDIEAQGRLAGIDFQSQVERLDEAEARKIQAAYYAMIELVDDAVGTLLDALDATGQRENTLVVFMSDHGEMLGDHGLLLKGCRFYEGLVRVPLVVSWPGRVKKGVLSDALVELTDVAPTLLDFAGLDVPPEMQGRTLKPILTGKASPDKHREYVRSEYYRALSLASRPGWEGSYATMIRDERYKLVVYHGHEEGELFDLEGDPWEFENLWRDPAHAEARFRLMQRSFDALAFAVDTGTRQTHDF